jgi:hypothetical protein
VRRFLLLVCGFAPVLALACYNDRDTLGYELYNKPDVQKALTGRFDRYPALYYTMRVNRLRAKGKLTADECDDMAVALGRLGRNDEALSALAIKAKLPNLSPMDQYRLYANRGTVEAHRWIMDGAKRSQVAELVAAERDIAHALKLNPHAHFGREGTQLEVIRWLMHSRVGGFAPPTQDSLGSWLSGKLNDGSSPKAVDIPMTLAGLIMLGGAWESPDVALAVGVTSGGTKVGIAELAYDRYKELVSLGRKPFDKDLSDAEVDALKAYTTSPSEQGDRSTDVRFKALRKEADAWHADKERYMLSRLNSGRHPDTDPTFWNDWKEPQLPEVPITKPTTPDWEFKLLFSGVPTVILGLAVLERLIRHRRKVGR